MRRQIICLAGGIAFSFFVTVIGSCGEGIIKVPGGCFPDCGARVCGPVPNGCGERCGNCVAPESCDVASGECQACKPDCSGRECGPDPQNCGTSCGTCPLPDQHCHPTAGRCEGCSPDCGTRVCGPVPNGCGESCGSCDSPLSCNISSGQCESCAPDCGVRVCGPVPNRCGESCGACEASESCDGSSGQCERCAPDCSGRECGPDPQNCGTSCGTCPLPDQHCHPTTGRCEGCNPDCGARVCGPVPNGCGESCGSCADSEPCDVLYGHCVDLATYLSGFSPGSSHEARPHGVPSSYDWSTQATGKPRTLESPANYVNWWGQIYVDETNNHAENVRVEVRNVRLLFFYLDRPSWEVVQVHNNGMEGGGYPEDFRGSTTPINMRKESNGGYSFVPQDGYNSHFYTKDPLVNGRTGKLVHALVIADVRVILDNPLGADNRDSSNYIIGFGADIRKSDYECPTVDGTVICPAFGDGKFIRVTKNWRKSVSSTLSSTDLNSLPMPPASLFLLPDGG